MAQLASDVESVSWETDELGEQFVSIPEVCGSVWWANLHSWAENIRDAGCSSCGVFAVDMAVAMHDLVNDKLGKPIRDQANLDRFADLFAHVSSSHAQAAQDEDSSPGPDADQWGSRCRDALGRWIPTEDCVGIEIDALPVSDRTFALGQLTGTRYEFRWRAVAVDQLVTSHDPFTFAPNPEFPADLQPRLRDRAATRLQVERMAGNIDADLLLTDFHTLDRGAPIIGRDLIVESGNGRVMALQRAVSESEPSYQTYTDELRRRIQQFGMFPDDLTTIEGAVLVRERLTTVDRREFAQEANISAAISSSAIENARTDAEKITPAMLGALQVLDGEAIEKALRATRNVGFVSSFLATLSEQEQAQLVDSDGRVNQEGVRRVTMALFVSAFPGDAGLRMAEKFFESVDGNVKNVFNGLLGSLGELVQAESLASSGERDQGLAIGEDLAKVVIAFSDIKATPGMTVENWINQGRLFERELDDFQEQMLRDIDDRSRSGRRVSTMLTFYTAAVFDAPHPSQAGFFDDVSPGREELWESAKRAQDQMATAAQSDPTELVDWCNVETGDIDRLWSWRPFRTSAALAIGLDSEVQVCSIGLTGDEYQLSVDGGEDQGMVRKFIAGELGRHARQVPEQGSDRLVWEVVVPGPEPEDLELVLVVPDDAPRREEPQDQPALFQDAEMGNIAGGVTGGFAFGVGARLAGIAADMFQRISKSDPVCSAEAGGAGTLSAHAIGLDVSGAGEFVSEQMIDPADFDPGSFRTATQGRHRLRFACRKGELGGDGECQGDIELQSILHPREEQNDLVNDTINKRLGLKLNTELDELDAATREAELIAL